MKRLIDFYIDTNLYERRKSFSDKIFSFLSKRAEEIIDSQIDKAISNKMWKKLDDEEKYELLEYVLYKLGIPYTDKLIKSYIQTKWDKLPDNIKKELEIEI